ncbi:hypothetical protein CK203_095379 [Vitis vinifera]|uniref:Uncharacterized protein n=1 Tax=Vitis vinifera TaxID=29760 RepID=A0A438BTJ6_VITVI|nr:hypothetical protein CK203_095379 [Vitis vinifera]
MDFPRVSEVFSKVTLAPLTYMEQLRYWKWVLLCFELVSRLKTNLQKCEKMLAGEVDKVDRLAYLFACRIETLPATYLGLASGAPH